jgi:predicted DNA-binding transcriptional regulator AlpA
MDELLSQKEVAQKLRISERTLERHRLAGTGPRYARLGRLIRYRECDVADWVHDTLRTSTSQKTMPKPTRDTSSSVEAIGVATSL